MNPIEALKRMKEGVVKRRKSINCNKDGRFYGEILKENQRKSSLRYRQRKSGQKTKDDVERHQSKISEYFEVKEE